MTLSILILFIPLGKENGQMKSGSCEVKWSRQTLEGITFMELLKSFQKNFWWQSSRVKSNALLSSSISLPNPNSFIYFYSRRKNVYEVKEKCFPQNIKRKKSFIQWMKKEKYFKRKILRFQTFYVNVSDEIKKKNIKSLREKLCKEERKTF